jgi:GDSL-like lipase/acylhydrolase family protein
VSALRLRWILLRGALGFAAMAVAIALCEIVLRVVSPGYSPLFLDIYRMEDGEVVGLRPGITREHLTSEWRVKVAINREGLRDRAMPLPDDGGRVLALGDSFAFGWGVELEQSYLFLAEESLRSDRVRIIKAGIPGTGTSDQLRWLRKHGEEYSPRLVVLSLFVGNDFVDVQMGGVPAQFTVRDGLMVKKALSEEGRSGPWLYELKERLKVSSLVAQRLAQAVWVLEDLLLRPEQKVNPGLNAEDRWLWEFVKVHLREHPPETVRGIELTLESLDETLDWCEQHGADLLLLVIPRSIQIYEWELDKWKQAYHLDSRDLDLDRPQHLLADWASRNSVALLDLLPSFRDHHRENPQERLFFYPNAHMNPNGHRLTASLLTEAIRRKLPPRPRSDGFRRDP